MTISDTIPVAIIVGGGISLCVAGFSKQGLPVSEAKRITGRPAKLIGILSLIISLVGASVWVGLRSAIGE